MSSQNQLAAYYMVSRSAHHGLVQLAAGVAATLLACCWRRSPVHASFIGLKASWPPVGGFSSLPGAIVGGLVIGIAGRAFYAPAGVKDAPYVVVLIMLMVRPGLLRRKTAQEGLEHT
jgi:branched-chain amino acid transport system permease protein